MLANNRNPILSTYHALFELFANHAHLDFAVAMEIYVRMSKTVPELKPDIWTFFYLMKMSQNHKMYELVLSFYTNMQKEGFTPSLICAQMAVDACDNLAEEDKDTNRTDHYNKLKSNIEAFIEKTYPGEVA